MLRFAITKQLHTNAYCAAVLALLSLTGCVTTKDFVPYGINERYTSFIPARIAVAGCRPWPPLVYYRYQPRSSFDQSQMNALCKGIDEFIVGGFRNQPFMRGFSPTAVEKLLQRNQKSELLERIDGLFKPLVDCKDCTNAPSYFQKMVADNEDWLMFLRDFREGTRNADALLIPFVLFAYDQQGIDRGLYFSRRAVGVSLMLIDTDRGHLIWSGGREAQVVQQQAPRQPPSYPPFTSIATLLQRLLVEDIWRDFPGRLFL